MNLHFKGKSIWKKLFQFKVFKKLHLHSFIHKSSLEVKRLNLFVFLHCRLSDQTCVGTFARTQKKVETENSIGHVLTPPSPSRLTCLVYCCKREEGVRGANATTISFFKVCKLFCFLREIYIQSSPKYAGNRNFSSVSYKITATKCLLLI